MHTRSFRRRALLQWTALSPLGGVPLAMANAAPPSLKGLQFVLPTPPGSQPDVIARWLIEPMARKAGVPGTVLNVPGAAGALAPTRCCAPPRTAAPCCWVGWTTWPIRT